MSTTPFSWISSTVTISNYYPPTLEDCTTQMTVTLNLLHPNPEMLIVALENPSGSAAFLGYYSSGAIVPCQDFFVTVFEDGSTLQVLHDSQNSLISCPPPAAAVLTADGTINSNGYVEEGRTTTFRNPTNYPFMDTFLWGNNNGDWTLMVYSNSSLNGTLMSWGLNFTGNGRPLMIYCRGGDHTQWRSCSWANCCACKGTF